MDMFAEGPKFQGKANKAGNLLKLDSSFWFAAYCTPPPSSRMKDTPKGLKIEITTPYSAVFPARRTNSKVMTCLCMWIIPQQQSSNILKDKYKITQLHIWLNSSTNRTQMEPFPCSSLEVSWANTPCWFENSVCVGRLWGRVATWPEEKCPVPSTWA